MSNTIRLALAEMSHTEKLRAMEALWDDLCHAAEGVASPPWHGEVLAERTERVAKGQAEFRDWAEVKARLLRLKK